MDTCFQVVDGDMCCSHISLFHHNAVKLKALRLDCAEFVQQHFRWNKIPRKSDLSRLNQIVPRVDLSPLLSILGWIIASVLRLKLQSGRFGIVTIKEMYWTEKISDVCLGKYISPTGWALYTTVLVRASVLKCVWRVGTLGCTWTRLWIIYTHKNNYFICLAT